VASLLQRKLVVVTGKGGVGKSTVSAALGLLGARAGRRTVVVEVGEQHRLPTLFGHPAGGSPGVEVELEPGLWSTSISPYDALLEWVETQVGGRVPARLLGSSNAFQYFVAAAPGAREVVTMAKVWELAQSQRWRRRTAGYDLVVVDAPSTGHALGMLRAPRTFAAIARVGPIATQAERVREFLEDPGHSGYLGVAQATEMAVGETLELEDRLRHQLGRRLQAVVVNGVLPRRFSPAELSALGRAEAAPGGQSATRARAPSDTPDGREQDGGLVPAAARAARAVHVRASAQRSQVARLRRHQFDVASVPFMFMADLDLAAVRTIADTLAAKLP